MVWLKRLLLFVFVAALLALAVWGLMPAPMKVETGTVTSGTVSLTLDEEGRTRARHVFVVSAPLAGRLERVALKAGDEVAKGQIVARLRPALPALLDLRARGELGARADAAGANLEAAKARRDAASATLEFAAGERERLEPLSAKSEIARREFEQARANEAVARAELAVAGFAIEAATHELAAANAALLFSAEDPAEPFAITAPVSGRVLEVLIESEQAVQPGQPILRLADTRALEIVADFLSRDAVRIQAGQPVRIERWGGEGVLDGRVRLVEPGGFTRISTLGVEEQRVNVIVDFAQAPPVALSDGYACEVRVLVREARGVKCATAALVQDAQGSFVFVASGGRATARRVKVGLRGVLESEILDGLAEGETVVLFPPEKLKDGASVEGTR